MITNRRKILEKKSKEVGGRHALRSVEVTMNTNITLAEMAVKHPSASRVFHRHGLDFCCHGNRALDEACAERGLSADSVLIEIGEEEGNSPQAIRWEERPIRDLISHIVDYYHRRLRDELPALIAMAARVEKVHAEKATCPRGLADLLERIHTAVLDHLTKEECILFPLMLAGRGAHAGAPIHVMEVEHREHAENLRQIRALTSNLVPPPEACATWRALYLRLEAFEAELMEHIHLENNVLFRRVLCE
jgi:regulator of cell morphogenesis and NO signaling